MEAGRILDGFRRFDLVVRLPRALRSNQQQFGNLLVSSPTGQRIPLRQLADLTAKEGPVEVSRENGQRRISVEANVRGTDIASFVEQAQRKIENEVKLPPGYLMTWGCLVAEL